LKLDAGTLERKKKRQEMVEAFKIIDFLFEGESLYTGSGEGRG
jgi:hypothetical protein